MGEISEALRRATGGRPARVPPPQQPAREDDQRAETPVADGLRRSADEAGARPARPAEPAEPARPVASPTRAAEPEPEPELEVDAVFELANRETAPSAARVSLLAPTDPGAVAARQLAQQVKRQADLRGMRSIVVTSPLSGDGKTTVSCNLAVALSRLDRSRSVALLELDLRRPTMARDFGLSIDAGVDDALAGRVSLDEAVRRTDVPGLDIIPVRRPRAEPESLLSSVHLRKLIETLERRYSILIVDTPPLLAVADTAGVLEVVDGCVLVARAGSCPSKSIERAVSYIPDEKALGCCLNYAKPVRSSVDYDSYTPHADLVDEIDAEEVRA